MTEQKLVLIYILILLGVLFLYFALQIISRITKWPWFCKCLGWHDGKGPAPKKKKSKYPDVNIHATCSKCGKEVMIDSQGNWF